MDALHTPQETVALCTAQEQDYLLAFKGNQPLSYAAVEQWANQVHQVFHFLV